jgi:hypothetical protein
MPSLRSAIVIAAFIVCSNFLLPQVVSSAGVTRKTHSQESLSALIDALPGLSAEYKADLAFSVLDAEHGSLSTRIKRTLIREVFQSAATAHYPYMPTEATGITGGDTLTHDVSNDLHWLKLDGLDIQVRAIEYALPWNPQFATTLFEGITLDEPRAACSDPAVPDVSAFFTILSKILDDVRVKTISKQDKFLYLQTVASSLKSPSQLAPMANLLAGAHLSATQMRQVEMSFVSSLNALTGSDRELVAAEEHDRLTHAVEVLASRFRESSVDPDPLTVAYRDFLIRSLTRERCSDYSLDRKDVARQYNRLIATIASQERDSLLLSEVDLHAKSNGGAALDRQIPFDRSLLPPLTRIRLAHSARLAEEYRSGNEGTIEPEISDVEDVLKYISAQNSIDSDCVVCDFYAKCTVAMMLKDILPAGNELERAIEAEVDFLTFSSVEKANPIVWLKHFKQLLNSARTPDRNSKAVLDAERKKGRTPWGLPNPEAAVIVEALRKSPDYTIETYIKAEDILHFPYQPHI